MFYHFIFLLVNLYSPILIYVPYGNMLVEIT